MLIGLTPRARAILWIQTITAHDGEYIENTTIDLSTYYNDVIGVTKKPGQRDVEVVFWIDAQNAPYVITKPLYHTKKLLSEDEKGKSLVSV